MIVCLHKKILYEVHQSFTLGPLLFFLYVNDRFLNVDHRAIMYADDMTLLIAGANKLEVIRTLNKVLESVQMANFS